MSLIMKINILYNDKEEIKLYENIANYLQEADNKRIVNLSHPKLKVRRGRTQKNEKYWYTDSNCFKRRFRFQYYFMKYSSKIFMNISEFEYEMNEFYFSKDNDFYYFEKDYYNDFVKVFCCLTEQFENIKDHNFDIVIKMNFENEKASEIWMYFFEKRKSNRYEDELFETEGLVIEI